MKKELLTHFLFAVPFIIFATLVKGWLALGYWPFWMGGIIGTLLPYADHFFYVYLFQPQDLSSQRVTTFISQKKVASAFDLVVNTAQERSKLIFHTAYFQLIFLVLTFWVVTSSGSLLGRGLVLAFSLHLLIDQLEEYLAVKNLNSWFRDLPFIPPALTYFAFNVLALLVLAFLF